MFTAFAPPAIRYPPSITVPSSQRSGRPAMYIGAAVVTSNNEIIVGFVSITRSRHNGRSASASTASAGVVTPLLLPSMARADESSHQRLRRQPADAVRDARHMSASAC